MVEIYKPRRGSMAFRPRKRASTQNVNIETWPKRNETNLLGLAGYKVGMTHVSYIADDFMFKGSEMTIPATVIEIPPILVSSIRGYKNKQIVGEILTDDEKILKMLNVKKKKEKREFRDVDDVRVVAIVQPKYTGIGKKHVEKVELGIGGNSVGEKMTYAISLLGKELKPGDVFKPGEYVDVVSVTKGKGWQGPVKRFGVAKQRRKATGKIRHVGSLGAWHPAIIMYTVPRAGQMGYHKRTELNKRILKIGNNGEEINPAGGFTGYGFVHNNYIILKGSVPGPSKRLIKLRKAIRKEDQRPVQITEISKESKQ